MLIQVGEYFKSPMVPIWVVGSEVRFGISLLNYLTRDTVLQSHYTIVFGTDLGVNEETPSASVHRIFRRFDKHGGGFIDRGDLSKRILANFIDCVNEHHN